MPRRVAKATIRVPDPDDPSKSHEVSFSWRLPSHRPIAAADITQAMLDQAIALVMGGSRCESDIHLTPNKSISTDTASIICYALACELYLKVLCSIAGVTPPKIHPLKTLFECLPTDARNVVQHLYADHLQVAPDAFVSKLAAVSDAFVEWRYKHEFRPIFGVPFELRDIATALHRAVRVLQPNLDITHEGHVATAAP